MNLSYGLAKTGGATEFDWAFDTDLGIQTNFEPAVSIIPAKGAISKLVSGLANLTVSTTITADAAGTTTALATTTSLQARTLISSQSKTSFFEPLKYFIELVTQNCTILSSSFCVVVAMIISLTFFDLFSL